MIPAPKGPPWWRPFARRRWRRALELPVDLPRRLAAWVAVRMTAVGLERAGDGSFDQLVLPDGRRIPQQHFWREIDPERGAIMDAAAEMVQHIAAKHGAGRVWGYPGLEIVHPIYDDGVLVKLDARNRPMARLRAVYHHEADAITPPAPPPRQCLGPDGDGCPLDALALPERHHCDRCLPIYAARYCR